MACKSQQMLMGVSVILPAYNAERYIGKCIKSVLTQTYANLELIIVNDGSTDSTLRICQEFAEKDKRIVIIDKKNEGVGKARFDAVQQAHGEYISFVDADDYISKNALEVLHDKAVKYDADMVTACFCKVFYGIKIGRYSYANEIVNRVWTHEEFMTSYFKGFFGIFTMPTGLWGKLYRSHLLKDYLMPINYKFGEDYMANMKIFPHLRNVAFINNVVYYYRQCSGGTAHFMPYWMENIKGQYRDKKEEMLKRHLEKQFDNYLKVELINCLRTYVQQFITFKSKLREENIATLERELQDGIYQELVGVKYHDMEILNAIIACDAAKLYARIEYLYSHAPLKLKVKRFIYHFLQQIS